MMIERCIIANMSLNLIKALRMEFPSSIAFVGAGGKTTLLFQVAKALIKENAITTVIVTATSHLGVWQIPMADVHIVANSASSLEENKNRLLGIVLITGELDADRTTPINEEVLNWLRQYCDVNSIPLLIEADGSRQKPLKAWSANEPPIPSFVDHVVQLVGLTGLQQSLDDKHIHRPEIFSDLSGLNIGDRVTTETLIRVLKHPQGGLKNIPAQARRTVLLNQADTQELQAIAQQIVDVIERMLEKRGPSLASKRIQFSQYMNTPQASFSQRVNLRALAVPSNYWIGRVNRSLARWHSPRWKPDSHRSLL